MAYDKNLDETIREEELEMESGNVLVFAIRSYNKGRKKLQVTRKIASGEGWLYKSMGRLTFEELTLVEDMFAKFKDDLR